MENKILLKVCLLVALFCLLEVRGNEVCKFGDGCTFSCHCKNNAPCDPNTGYCEECDDGLQAGKPDFYSGVWWGPGCQIGNIAYGKPAEQFGTYTTFNASHAVDGYKGFPFQIAYCAHPFSKDRLTPTWWRVDLGEQHLIYNVTILNRAEDDGTPMWLDRLWNTIIGVGNFSTHTKTYHVQCAFIKENDTDFNDETNTVTKQCTPNLVGKYVSLQRTGNKEIQSMNFCEVYVTGYKVADCAGSWGPGSLSSCNCESQCHLVTGECSTSCVSGWTGSNCQSECALGFWGPECVRSCNCKHKGDVCNRFDGSCPNGCKDGFAGNDCYSNIFYLNQENLIMTSSDSSAVIYFMSWDPSLNDTKEPDFYRVEYKMHSDHNWKVGREVNHEKDGEVIEVILENLQENIKYSIQIVPGVSPSGFSNSNDTPAVVGGTLGGILSICFLAVIAVLFHRRRKANKTEENTVRNEQHKSEIYEEIQIPEPHLIEAGEDNFFHEEASVIYETPEKTEQPSPPKVYDHLIFTECQPIPVSDLGSCIQRRKHKLGFRAEFDILQKNAIAPCKKGNLHSNKIKNRFVDIIAYDHSRVLLDKEPGDILSDYINANYIRGYNNVEKKYIAAQAPLPHTAVDMWRMIWQVGANRIVIVSNPEDMDRRISCDKYWPANQEEEIYGNIIVKMIKEDILADSCTRDILVSSEGIFRTVRMFNFTSWSESNMLPHATALLDFHRQVKYFDRHATGPMIVHCSSGTGPTGIFIAIDYLLDQAKTEQMVDVFQCVLRMRQDRINMVQTLDQYVFVYNTLYEALLSGETAVPAAKFHSELAVLKQIDQLKLQYNVLETLKNQRKSEAEIIALKKENIVKNRDQEIVPDDAVRPVLITKVPGTNDYINAVYVNGYKDKLAYLVTQAPQPKTCADIWRLVFDHNCCSIVMLNKTGKQDVPVYWPNAEQATITHGFLNINYVEENNLNAGLLLSRQFEIVHKKKKNTLPLRVQQFVLQCWPEGEDTPTSMSAVLELLEHVEKWQQHTGNGPIIIHCINGATRSGLLVSAMYMLDKLKVDQEVDVFQSVKSVRINRPQLVTSLEQYIFLYDLAAEFMNNFGEYANFK